MEPARVEITAAPFEQVHELAAALSVDPLVAELLIRRGIVDVEGGQRFLRADERYEPVQFERIDQATALILSHVEKRSVIVVHGDYDVDGVCATTVLVATLRELGAEVEWFIPGRREDGYGLCAATVERLAAGPAALLITVDCAITAVEEVALARSLGLDVVVTDHHQPRADGLLPDAPVVHPRVCGYPDPELCATAVAAKLAEALRSAAGHSADRDRDLDLVALATVADCVPLLGENRRLVREGLVALARTARPGLRALMRVAQVDPAAIDEQAIGFRLAPRINAAGRMHRADSGVELLLADDPERADAIAGELDHANAERRLVETRIRYEAEAQATALGPRDGYVLSSDDWHPGVIGIVASRLAELHGRPVVIVALDGDEGSGSGRSVPGFDLLAGLQACAGDLLRFGGHRAAAGCTVSRESLAAFADHFDSYCAEFFAAQPAGAQIIVDAVVGGDVLSMDLAEQLARLGPFGIGNQRPTLMIPAARLDQPRSMGEGKHLRCTINSGGVRIAAVAFGTAQLPDGADVALDLIGSLEINRWRGAEDLRFVIRQALPPSGSIELVGRPAERLDAFAVELYRSAGGDRHDAEESSERQQLDCRGAGLSGLIRRLVAGGEAVLVVAANEQRRAAHLSGRIGGFALTSWSLLLAEPQIADRFTHLVALDPPTSEPAERLLRLGPQHSFAHLAWGAAELRFTGDELQRDADLRGALAAVYRAVRDEPQAGLLAQLTAGDELRSPAAMATIVRVFEQLGLATLCDGQLSLLADDGPRQQLDSSPAYLEWLAAAAEGVQWLNGTKPLAV